MPAVSNLIIFNAERMKLKKKEIAVPKPKLIENPSVDTASDNTSNNEESFIETATEERNLK